jgi:hypothetical protein
MNQEPVEESGAGMQGEFEEEVAALAERARSTIEEFVRAQPHAALGVAAAAGFILGGGLTPRRLFRLGLAAGGPALSRQVIDQVVRVAREAFDDEGRPTTKPKVSHRHRAKGGA